MNKPFIFALLVLFLVACARTAPALDPQKEVARLMTLSNKHTLSSPDLDPLKTALASDEYASDELSEVEIMIKYQEYDHATHALAFIDTYLASGKMMNCPGHALGHYYVFMRHGENDRADDALAEAKDGLAEWQTNARPADSSANETITRHIASIESGNTTATDEDIDTLTNLMCVEGEHAHNHD